MPYQIIPHTADYSVIFYGNNIDEFFKGISLFFKKEIIDMPSNMTSLEQVIIKSEYNDENFSYMIVTLLNDIIFYMEQGNVLEDIEIIKSDRTKLSLNLYFYKVKDINFKTELKAATYHNLELTNINDKPISLKIVFDL